MAIQFRGCGQLCEHPIWPMITPGINHGTVGQGGFICGLEENLEEFAKVRARSTSPDLSALSPHMERGTHWRVKYLEYQADFGYRF